MAVFGMPGGAEWWIICLMCLPVLIISAVALVLATRRRANPPAQAPAWLTDPTGRHEFRYWNGSGWTEDVSDSGNRSIDPI